MIVDFAHNEAGVSAVLDVAEGIAGGAAGRAAPVTAIIGTAGDRPDDTLRGIGRIAGQRAQRVAIKETLQVPPRPEPRVDRRRDPGRRSRSAGPVDGRRPGLRVRDRGAPRRAGPDGDGASRPDAPAGHRPDVPRGARGGVRSSLAELGARPVDVGSELTTLVPRLQTRPRRA